MTAPFPKEDIEGSIPGRFRRVARAYPNRPAVSEDGRTVTYAELEALAAAFAAALADRLQRSEPQSAGRPRRSRRSTALRGDAGNARGRAVLRPARPGVAGCAAPVDPARSRRGRGRHRRRLVREDAGPGPARGRGARARDAARRASDGGFDGVRVPRRPRVRPLHVGLDRPAEGRDAESSKPPAQRVEAVERPRDRAGGSDLAPLVSELRGVRVGHLRGAPHGRVRLSVRSFRRRSAATARFRGARGHHDLSLRAERVPESVLDARRPRRRLDAADAQARRRGRARIGSRSLSQPVSAKLRLPRRPRGRPRCP